MFGFGRSDKPAGASQAPASWLGVGGHGLLLAPACPCGVLHRADGSLFIVREEAPQPRTVEVRPGAAPATVSPEENGQREWRLGPDGPTLRLGGSAQALADVVVSLNVGLGASPWNLLTFGAWVELPAGFSVFTGPRPDFPELHLGTDPTQGAFLSFLPQSVAPAQLSIKPAAGQELSDEGVLEGDSGAIRWQQLSYVRDSVRWRQRFYALPSPTGTLLLRAQAPESRAAEFWSGADLVAETYSPT